MSTEMIESPSLMIFPDFPSERASHGTHELRSVGNGAYELRAIASRTSPWIPDARRREGRINAPAMLTALRVLREVPDDQLDMSRLRKVSEIAREGERVGCILDHCLATRFCIFAAMITNPREIPSVRDIGDFFGISDEDARLLFGPVPRPKHQMLYIWRRWMERHGIEETIDLTR